MRRGLLGDCRDFLFLFILGVLFGLRQSLALSMSLFVWLLRAASNAIHKKEDRSQLPLR